MSYRPTDTLRAHTKIKMKMEMKMEMEMEMKMKMKMEMETKMKMKMKTKIKIKRSEERRRGGESGGVANTSPRNEQKRGKTHEFDCRVFVSSDLRTLVFMVKFMNIAFS